MVFNNRNKGFFLTLDEEAAPADLSIPSQAVDNPEPAEITAEPVVAPDSAVAPQTTAEAIAAELAAAEQSRPAVTMATFAPENLLPGTGLRARRRQPGASLGGFRAIASDLFKV